MPKQPINTIQYIPKKQTETNDFLMRYLKNEFNIEEKHIVKLIVEYKTQLEKLDICVLRCVSNSLYQSEFITQFISSLQDKIPCVYSKSWDHQMGYWASGHDIRFSYALYHNDKIWIKEQLGNKLFYKLENVIDINGIKLKDSNHYDRNFRD